MRPNIVLIVADDLGYGDFSAYGAQGTSTPNVDRLARNGIHFTDAYVASSLCSPSRYSILTGRYSWRTPLKTGVLKPFSPPLIEAEQMTLASLLRRKGYFTACVGKWHLGFDWKLKDSAPPDADIAVFDAWGLEPQEHIDFAKAVDGGPRDRGFDYFFGIAGSNNMIPFVFIENERVVSPPSVPTDFGLKRLRAPEWDLRTLDQTLARKAVEVIDRHFQKNSQAPLFLYFPTSAIHAPCLPSRAKGTSDAGLRGDMVQEFDRVVGEVVSALEKHRALDQTLLVVTSDNGPQPGDPYIQIEKLRNVAAGRGHDLYQRYFSDYSPVHKGVGGQPQGWLTYGHDATGGLLGFKSDAWEGGLRVPFIVHWSERITPGRKTDQLICASDLLATFAELTGQRLQEHEGEDSYSFLASLLNENAVGIRRSVTLVAGRSGALTIRKGKWKYIEPFSSPVRTSAAAYPPPPNEFPGYAGVDETQLYNLEDDRGERNNLSHDHPAKVSELKSLMNEVQENGRTEGK